MEKLIELINDNEEVLMRLVLADAEKYGFTKYTSTLLEAWRISIEGLNASMAEALKDLSLMTITVDGVKPSKATDFGVIEAQKHRTRGITAELFLSLMKYYRKSYLELIQLEHDKLSKAERDQFESFIYDFFDIVEIAFISEWNSNDRETLIGELQTKNRSLTNEKNMYLTMFESLPIPVLILNNELELLNLNFRALQFLSDIDTSGAVYYHKEYVKKDVDDVELNIIERLKKINFMEYFGIDVSEFIANPAKTQMHFISNVIHDHKKQKYSLELMKMLDVSNKYTGLIITFTLLSELIE